MTYQMRPQTRPCLLSCVTRTQITLAFGWQSQVDEMVFAIHGCLDGHLRRIMFLNCSTNNKAARVLQLFLNEIQNFGIPSRIRSDQGTENVEVARYMISHPNRGPGRGSFIARKSCRNPRILLRGSGEICFKDVPSYSITSFAIYDAGHNCWKIQR